MKKLLAVLLAVLMLVSFAACGGDKDDKTGIVFGVITPTTGSVSQYGIGVLNGIKLAIEEINAAGGILGEQVTLDIYDSKGDVTEGTNAMNALIDKDVDAVIGAVISSVTAAVAPVANEAGMVTISASSTADPATEGYDYVFRSCFSDSFQGKIAAKYCKQLGHTKAAILYIASDPYSAGLYDAFVEEAKTLGIEIVDTQSASSTDDIDFTTQLTSIVSKDVDFLYAPCYYSAIGSYIVPQARNAGFDGIIMGSDGYDGTIPYMVEPLSMYEKVYFTNHYSKDDTSDVVQNFVKAYTDKYGADALNAFSALAYDATYMLRDAIEDAGSTDKEAVKNAMAAIEFSGVTGTFTLDETGTPQKGAAILGFKDGQEVWIDTINYED